MKICIKSIKDNLKFKMIIENEDEKRLKPEQFYEGKQVYHSRRLKEYSNEQL